VISPAAATTVAARNTRARIFIDPKEFIPFHDPIEVTGTWNCAKSNARSCQDMRRLGRQEQCPARAGTAKITSLVRPKGGIGGRDAWQAYSTSLRIFCSDAICSRR
jgi:hypothetical protein